MQKCCNKDCDQGRECPWGDEPVITFDIVVGFIRNLLAGVGIIACIVAIGFWSAR